MQRYGTVMEVKEEQIAEYNRLHANTWPGVLQMIHEANIRNYSIYLRKLSDGRYYLFSYYEYVGTDHDADMARVAANPVIQEWWKVCTPCLVPIPDRAEGEWWASMEEVFHCDGS